MRRLVAGGLLLAALAGSACSEKSAAVEAADNRTVQNLDVAGVPGTLRGLSVVKEDVQATVENAERPYFDGLSFFSLREGEKLQATLQVGRFAEGTAYRTGRFRSSLLATIGGGTARELRMGEDRVFLTTGDRQSIAVWFRDQYVFILSSREDYRFPRALLREALAVQP